MESQEKDFSILFQRDLLFVRNFCTSACGGILMIWDMRLLFVNLHPAMILMPCFRFLGKNIVQYLILIPCCHGLRWMTEHR